MASSSGRDAGSSRTYWSIWAYIVAQVLKLLFRLRSSADPNFCSFSGRNLNRFSVGVVDAEVDGIAVDDDAESDRKKASPDCQPANRLYSIGAWAN